MSYNWCFTLNNYSDEEYERLQGLDCRYIVLGKEVGLFGTPHIQGFVVMHKAVRMSAMKKVNLRAHWESARGSAQQAAEYCKKDGDYWEKGDCPLQQGASEVVRWESSKTMAREGKIDDIPADIYIRYYRTLKEIAKDHMVQPPDAEDVTGVWIYGAPGVGKSRKARIDYPKAYLKMQNKWWDGYQGEEFVILDDFDSKELGHHLKIWADRYAFLAETKGGAVAIRPKKFVITSNYAPDDSRFGWDKDMVEAIKRRFMIVHMTNYDPMAHRFF